MEDIYRKMMVSAIAFPIKIGFVIFDFLYGSIFYNILWNIVLLIAGIKLFFYAIKPESWLDPFLVILLSVLGWIVQLMAGSFVYLTNKVDDGENKEPKIVLKICVKIRDTYDDVKDFFEDVFTEFKK